MRCEKCGRPMKSAEMWRLGGDPKAPTSRSMRQMCWDCRQPATNDASAAPQREITLAPMSEAPRSAVLEEAYAIVSAYEASLDSHQF